MNNKLHKIGGAVAIAAALLLACSQAGAQTSPTYAGVTITQTGTLVSNVPTPPLAINGQSSCGVSFSGGTSATIVPQGSSDPTSVGNPSNAAWVTASLISSSISYSGTTLGVAAAYPGGTAAFRLSPGTVVGAVTYSITCGAGVAPGSSSGGGGAITGTVQVSPVPLPVVVSSSVPLSVNTAAPYVAPTCSAAPNAPCVQATGPYPWPTDANGNPIHTLYGSTGAQIVNGNGSIDSVANSNQMLYVKGFGYVYNGAGTNGWDREFYCGIAAPVTINVTSGTVQLVGLSGSTNIRVCSYQFTLTGTSPTAAFAYGTGTNCGTGTTTLGAMAPTSGSVITSPSGGASNLVFEVPAGDALCLTVGGTSPSAQGWLTYVRY
jgi:hypothetical protein